MPLTIADVRAFAVTLLFAAGWLEAGWQKISVGPFEIYTDQDIKAAKQLLGTLEQLRHQVETLTGVQDPKPLWPIRLLIAKGQAPSALQLTTAFQHMIVPSASISREQKKTLAVALLHPNSGPLEPGLEAALLSILGGLESSGARVTLGALPPAAEQTPDWVLLNYLVTTEQYRGRLRVFLGNLMRGADKASALRNGFEEDETALRKSASAERPRFAEVTFAAKPILPERDYRARDIEDAEARLELAIARLDRNGCAVSKELAALECMAAASTNEEAALAAIAVGSRNARMHYLAGVLQLERLEHQRQLFTAIQLKPLYPEAALAFASKENDSMKAFKALKDASPAAQRDPAFLAKLATVAEAAGQFADAAKAWANAERATHDPAARERMAQSRLRSVDQRLEAEALARREAEEARLRDIERVRQESLARVRAAEAKARAGMKPLADDERVEQWWDGEQVNAYFIGTLTRIECLGRGKARFTLVGENETRQFDVDDPAKIVVMGAGAEELQFRCGVQGAPRKVRAGYVSPNVETLVEKPAAQPDPNFRLAPEPEGQLKKRPSESDAPTPPAPKPAAKSRTVEKRPAKPSVTAGKILTLEVQKQ
jgi:hypothetical protein